MTIAYVGVVTIDTVMHNNVIVERAASERRTAAEAIADAKAIIAGEQDIEVPNDSIGNVTAGFIELRL